ncbi:UNVERIFIED_CONTAM: Remorin [Sesamum latifolium]|uniref:Remorin n=1 Tax=Sesamum latifolium TaxID=2727402 RepID=A0AAW2T7A1_9LAMI
MAEEEAKKAEPEPSPEAPPAAEEPVETPKDVAEEKAVIPLPPAEEKAEECKALAVVEKEPEAAEEKKPEGSINRDAVLARVATEKRLSLIKAWEESEKSKAENKTSSCVSLGENAQAQKKVSAIAAWENSKKASLEAELKKIEQLEKKKAEYIEKMKNKVALLHKAAEEKRAMIEAKRGEDLLKAEEIAAKYRATGTAPKKLLGCF